MIYIIKTFAKHRFHSLFLVLYILILKQTPHITLSTYLTLDKNILSHKNIYWAILLKM